MRSFIPTILAAVLFFGAFSVYREHLVSRQAGPEERAALLTGDEPHYLLTALALARGDGLNIGPAHAERAFERFQPKRIFRTDNNFTWADYRARNFRSFLDKTDQWQDKRYSLFSPLPSLVIAPWFLTPLNPVRWYMLATQGLALALILAWMLQRWQPADRAAWLRGGFVLLAGCATIPVGYYTSQLFPEVLSGMLLLAGLTLISGHASLLATGVGAALISAPLWATPRVLPAVGLLWLWSLCSRRPERRVEAVVLTLNLLLYAAFCLWLWGNPVAPQASAMLFRLGVQIGPGLLLTSAVLVLAAGFVLYRWGHLLKGKGWVVLMLVLLLALVVPPLKKCLIDIVAFFLTRQIGLFVLNPFLVVGAYAAWRWYREEPGEAFQRWFILFVGIILAVAFYADRRAGTCPGGRYQVMAAMLLMPPLLRSTVGSGAATRQLWWPGAVLLGGISLFLSFISALKPHYWFRNYPAYFGYAPLEQRYHLMPTAAEPRFLLDAAMLLAILLAILLVPGWLIRRQARAVTEAA